MLKFKVYVYKIFKNKIFIWNQKFINISLKYIIIFEFKYQATLLVGIKILVNLVFLV